MTDLQSRPRPGGADLLILGYVLGLLVLWFPPLHLPLLTPRVVLVAVGLGPGLVVVAALAARGDVVARWAMAYLAWGLVSVGFSAHPGMAFLRPYSSDLGWLYLAGTVSAWGLGRRLSRTARPWLVWVLAVGVGLNVAVALLEAMTDPQGPLAPADGRVSGLLPSPLYLAGILAGALALGGHVAGVGRRRTVALAALVPTAAALNLTGTRAALMGGAVLAVVAAFRSVHRTHSGVRTAAAVAGLVLGAVVLGVVASAALGSPGAGTDRLDDTAASSGYRSRQIMWAESIRVVPERPIVGWGPGRFREAVEPHTGAEFVRVEGRDRPFYDAHNVLLENLVSLGIVGLVLWAGLAISLIRRTRGPLAWFAGGIALTWLVNPVSVTTGPLALLAMGAAWVPRGAVEARSPIAPERRVSAGRLIGAGLALLGLVAGARLVLADHAMKIATEQHDLDAAIRAGRLVPGDAVITGVESQLRNEIARFGPTSAHRAAAVETAERAVRQDPTRPTWQVNLGNTVAEFGRGAEPVRLRRSWRAYRRAEALDPYSYEALRMLHALAAYRGDRDATRSYRAKLCAIDACPDP